jgi:quinoprotein glucose dehydrogenase
MIVRNLQKRARAAPPGQELLNVSSQTNQSSDLIPVMHPFTFHPMQFPVRRALRAGFFLSLIASGVSTLHAAEDVAPRDPNAPKVAAASDEGERAIKSMQLPQGFRAEVFAAEPHLANPVAFDIDNQNRFWVAETFRLHAGVTDIRGKTTWLDEDLASRSVSDRIAMMQRHEGTGFSSYEQHADRVKLILDTDGDGKADTSTVFADGFGTAAEGIGAGVLSRNGKVYYTDIPNLWMLEDTNNDGVADRRTSLHYGFGVRVGFLGHDLHGLIMGPDGRLYFSIGDRGSNVETADGRHVGFPDTGCVFRCEPDGSNLEVFAYGLRNPQELAFDQYGNLFTGDNNSDGGDRARIVYLVEGGDSGWRVGFQFLERPNARGPWNSEKMWYPQNETQPEFLVPPVANLADGPSGFAYYPGTGLPDAYQEHFFLCDFHGARNSGIFSFNLQPTGAGFHLVQSEKFLWQALPTDVAFGPEGGIYFSDWVQGWEMTGKGRIYHVLDPEVSRQPIVAETKRLLMDGLKQRSNSDLAKLLAHVDMRVREEAQFELVHRAKQDVLAKVARAHASQLARLHAIWGLGQLARIAGPEQKLELAKVLFPLAADKDGEIRAQLARLICDTPLPGARDQVLRLLADSSPRVRLLAGIAAGKMKNPEFLPAVFTLLADNNDQDPYIRHAGAFALAGIQDMHALNAAVTNASPAIRMAALIAMRRLERVEIARFLQDSDPRIVLEAARAINDVPISGAMRDLALLASSPAFTQMRPELQRRIVNANFRYGTAGTARALTQIAANDGAPDRFRAEALRDLANWEHPSGRDQITGLWRPAEGARPSDIAAEAVEPQLAKLIQSAPDSVRSAAAITAAALRINSVADALLASVRSSGAPSARVEALRALATLHDSRLAEALQSAQADPAEELRREALKHQSEFRPADAIAQIETVLQNGTIGEKQTALGTLGSMTNKEADEILATWLNKLADGQVPKELQLDVLDAAEKRKSVTIKAKLQSWNASIPKNDPLAPFRVSLYGGNAQDGKKIFFERAEAACVRCHKIVGQGSEGGEVGPELTHVGSTKPREYILESIIFPNKQIAQGFDSLLVTTKDGTSYAGVVKADTADEVILNSPEDGIVKLKKSNITSRERGLSAMPEGMVTLLSKHDLRDLVEFLSSCK